MNLGFLCKVRCGMSYENNSTQYSRIREFPWQTIDGEAIIVEPQSQMSHEINEVGTLIWELLDGQRSLQEICTKVHEVFDVDRETAVRDTEEFLESLVEKGLANCPR